MSEKCWLGEEQYVAAKSASIEWFESPIRRRVLDIRWSPVALIVWAAVLQAVLGRAGLYRLLGFSPTLGLVMTAVVMVAGVLFVASRPRRVAQVQVAVLGVMFPDAHVSRVVDRSPFLRRWASDGAPRGRIVPSPASAPRRSPA